MAREQTLRLIAVLNRWNFNSPSQRFSASERLRDSLPAAAAVNYGRLSFHSKDMYWVHLRFDSKVIDTANIMVTNFTKSTKPPLPLKGIRVLSLSLNLPGPAALMRCQRMGASCVKLEPPASGPAPFSGDPMRGYNHAAYDALHKGIRTAEVDLKTDAGQQALHRELGKTDVLLTSFRPSALKKLGLEWKTLHKHYPQLSQVAIVGAPGRRAEEPGHDLTYLAQNDLVCGVELPATLYADMAGSLIASEAVLQAVLLQKSGRGHYLEVALSDAAEYLALPRRWGLTQAGAAVGGGHAGYGVYHCQDGRVAVAALEPHFAKALCTAAGIPYANVLTLLSNSTHERIANYLLGMTREALEALALEKDIPLCTMPA